MQVIREKSPLHATLAFTDEAGDAVVPTTAEWRIDDKASGDEVVDWTSIATVTNPVSIVVPASSNALLDQASVSEVRTLTIRIDVGLLSEAHQDIEYKIRNLLGVT